jgi:hypothetical protein
MPLFSTSSRICALPTFQQVERTLDGVRRGKLTRRRVDHAYQGLLALHGVDGLGQQFRRQVQVDAAGTARHGRTDRTRNADADVFRVQNAVRGLRVGLGGVELVHLLVVALLQVDDLTLAGSADQDHRETVRGRVGKRRQAVQEARR